jgi:hypothetical protein
MRREDKADALLGMFAAFMPLMYGEGDNAFARLREQIDKSCREDELMHHWLSKLPITRQAAFNYCDNHYGTSCLPNSSVELCQHTNN